MEDKREYYARLIEEWKTSGLAQKEFCARKGVKLSTYHYWNGRLNREQSSLVEIGPRLSEQLSAEQPNDLQLQFGAYRIVVRSGFDSQALEELIAFVEDRGAHA